jgi:transcriptional antiterminator NusG
MGEIVKKWYVIRAVSGKEKKVKEYLELEISRMKLGDYVNQILIPMEKVFKIQKGHTKIHLYQNVRSWGDFYKLPF